MLSVFKQVYSGVNNSGYMSLLQFEDDIMPFTFTDVLILRYLVGIVDEIQTVEDFNAINNASDMGWVFRTQLVKFIRRFWIDPYRKEDTEWIQSLVNENGIRVRSKIEALSKLI